MFPAESWAGLTKMTCGVCKGVCCDAVVVVAGWITVGTTLGADDVPLPTATGVEAWLV